MKKKDYTVIGKTLGIDVIVGIIIVILSGLHIFLINLHPIMNFIKTTNLTMVSANPGLLPSDAILKSGIFYIFALIFVTLLLAFFVFLFSRTIIYNILNKNKNIFKGFKQSLKLFFSGILVWYLPTAAVSFIIYVVLVGILIFLSYISGSNFFTYLAVIPQAFLVNYIIVLWASYFAYFQKQKVVFKKVGFFYERIGYLLEKPFKSVLLATGILLALYLIQIFILKKFAFIYYYSWLQNVWYGLITIIIFAYLRYVGANQVKKIK